MTAVPDSVLDTLRATPGTVELACDHHPDPATGRRGRTVLVWDTCLADIGLDVVAQLLAAGASEVVVRGDGCTAPVPVAPGLERWVVTETGTPHGWRTRHGRPVVRVGVRRVGRRVLVNPLGIEHHEPAEATTEHGRMRAALRELAAAGRWEPPDDDGPGLDLGADGCVADGTCVRACPEDALTLLDDDSGAAGLWFDPAACSGCRRCLELCDAGALSAAGQRPWADVTGTAQHVLATMRVTSCGRCGTRFTPEGGTTDLCPVCAFRRANPFGTQMPRMTDVTRDR